MYPNSSRRRGPRGNKNSWHPFIETLEVEFEIKNLVSTEGDIIREAIAIENDDIKKNLIQYREDYDPFSKAECGEKGYSYTGNEGVTAIHWYRLAVAVVAPNDVIDVFLTKNISATDARILLPQYLAKCSDIGSESDLESVKKVIYQLAKDAWSSTCSSNYYGAVSENLETVKQFVMAALRIRDYQSFTQSVEWLRDDFGHRLFAGVKKAVSEDPSFEFSQVKDSLLEALSILPVPRRVELLQTLGVWTYTSPAISSQIRNWVVDEVVPPAMTACLPAKGKLASVADGLLIAEMIYGYSDFEGLKTRSIPTLQQHVSSTTFALATLTRILSLVKKKQEDGDIFPLRETAELCKPLLESVLGHMNICPLKSEEGFYASETDDRWRLERDSPGTFIGADLLAEFLTLCLRLEWEDLGLQFCLKVIDQISSVPGYEIALLWFRFVELLISVLEGANIPLSTPQYRNLATVILEAYLDRYVGAEPSGVSDYSGQGPVTGCGCNNCNSLNQSLASGRRVWRLKAERSELQHVESKTFGGLSLLYQRLDGDPPTLKLTKLKDNGISSKEDWDTRFKQANHRFGTVFDQTKLKEMIGEEKWQRFTGMAHLRYKGPPSTETRENVSQPVTREGRITRSSMKRKAED